MTRAIHYQRTDFGTHQVLSLYVGGEHFLFSINNKIVFSIKWNGDMFCEQNIRQNKMFDIIRWLVPCRTTKDIYKTMMKFVLK